jgi:hypothetical protein
MSKSSSVLHAIGYHPSWETDEDDTADDEKDSDGREEGELSPTTSDVEPDTDNNTRTLHEYRLRLLAMTSFSNRLFVHSNTQNILSLPVNHP